MYGIYCGRQNQISDRLGMGRGGGGGNGVKRDDGGGRCTCFPP